jgi:hypothetical protein
MLDLRLDARWPMSPTASLRSITACCTQRVGCRNVTPAAQSQSECGHPVAATRSFHTFGSQARVAPA